jgi:uncharacterized cofD-like protein
MTNPESKPNVVVIGGGNGSSTVLESLLPYDFELTAVVTTTDSGGSSGRLRKKHPGLIGLGDLRQCIYALAGNHENARYLEERTEDGHALGNLALLNSALERGGVNHIFEAIEDIGKNLDLMGHVIPISSDDAHLNLRLSSGKEIMGEINIATYEGCIKSQLGTLNLTPEASLHPHASLSINKANAIIIAPGNLYGSIIPPLLTKGAKEAINNSKAPLIMVTNLANNTNTPGFTLTDYVSELERHTGLVPDVVIADKNNFTIINVPKLIVADLTSTKEIIYNKHDQISHTRSQVQHCGQMLGSLILNELR